MAPGRIALVRHGQTEWSAIGRHTSTTDLDLLPQGEVQARAIPALLDGLGINPVTVYSSPRTRALRTAELSNLTVSAIDEDLAEWAYGEYEGRKSVDIRADNPEWSVFTHGAPGGESPQQVTDRADRALARAREALVNGDVVLIGHGHMSRVLAARWIGLPVSAGSLLSMNAAAVTVLGHYHGDPALEHLNVIPFTLQENTHG